MSTARKVAFGVLTVLGGGYTYTSLKSPINPIDTTVKSPSSSSPLLSTAQVSNSSKDETTRKEHKARSYDGDVPKPVEDRHGDTVRKHSIAAEKNQKDVRIGKFSGREFDNHLQKHSGDPCDDFEVLKDERKG